MISVIQYRFSTQNVIKNSANAPSTNNLGTPAYSLDELVFGFVNNEVVEPEWTRPLDFDSDIEGSGEASIDSASQRGPINQKINLNNALQ